MRRYHIMMIALIFVGVTAFILPPQLMKWKDGQTVGISYVEKAEKISLVSQATLSLTEKMDLFQRETANNLWIAKGKNYDQESIRVKVLEELQKLCDLGILNVEADKLEFNAIEGGFVVDTADSTQTMNIWTIYAYHADKGYDLLLVLDDETGKIFSIRQSSELFGAVSESDGQVIEYPLTEKKVTDVVFFNEELQNIAKKWAEYLGLNLVEIYHTVTGTMDVDKEIEEEIQALIKGGMNSTEAYLSVYEAWGISPEYIRGHLLCVIEDEKGMAAYLIRKDIATIMLSINLSM